MNHGGDQLASKSGATGLSVQCMQSMGNPTEVDLPLLLARQMHFRFAEKGEKFPLDEKALIEGPFGRQVR